jgi:hypothetical protein
MADEKKLRHAELTAKARLLWRQILTTPGVADLASHVERDTPFDKLPPDEQLTAKVIVDNYDKGARVIDEEIRKRRTATGEVPTVAAESIETAGDTEARATSGAVAEVDAPASEAAAPADTATAEADPAA